MNVRGMIPIILFSLLLLHGCAPKYSDMIVLEVDSTKVSLREYQDFYTRNSGSLDSAQKSTPAERERFLDLLTNYKLKLQDAYDRNLLNDPEIKGELAEYRSSLASTFMIDREVTEPGIKQLYDRRMEEIRAKHVLISLKPDASPEETLKAYTRAMEVIKRAKAGENFDSLAVQFSDDPSTKSNHGDVYYFTGAQMVGQFEDAAYLMHKGEISSSPVRSSFGYHVINILDRGPVRGSIRVRHMMARFQKANPDSADTAAAYSKIMAMQDSLRKGSDFAGIAARHSEDAGTASQGGDLGWFERRRWVLPFDEAAFKLGVGQTSGIVRTPFGYHILRCDSARLPAPYALQHEELKKLYQQHRYNDEYAAYMTSLKNQFKYSFNDATFSELIAHLDSTKTTDDSAWDGGVTREIREMPAMSINGRPVPVDSVLKALGRRPEFRSASLRRNEMKTHFDHIGESLLLDEHSVGLESRSPEFAALMKEYTDGIILYKAEQTEVWNKTTVSDSALKHYYEQNKEKFVFPERVNFSEIYLESDTVALSVYDSLSKGADFAGIASRWNDDPDLKAKKGAKGFQPVGADDVVKHAAVLPIGEISEPIEIEGGGYAIIKPIAREQPRQKTYEEAGAEVSNAYQEYISKHLEQQWLESIRLKHPVKQHKELLQNAFDFPQAHR
jgi:peptidyl-prolyl cis-trans isomerase SurA